MKRSTWFLSAAAILITNIAGAVQLPVKLPGK